MEGRRFRHTAQFRRWREDRDPESCGYEQLEEPVLQRGPGDLGLGDRGLQPVVALLQDLEQQGFARRAHAG